MKVLDNEQCNVWYQALLKRNSEHTGVFFVGVKTTGVFCTSICRERKPKREHIEFYKDVKSALSAGFRPCKVCRPTENVYSAPLFVEQALELVCVNPKKRISDIDLRRRNATDVALDNGGEPLSGFGNNITDVSSTKYAQLIMMHHFMTPLGPMFVCATERGVCLLEFTDRRMLETELHDLQRLLNARIISGKNSHIEQAEKEINEYFSGVRQRFELLLDTPGSEFQCSVWQALRSVSYGQTLHYQELSELIGKPTAVRAVAGANGANRVAIIIPCHRIIGKNSTMTGYGGGITRKKWLIEHERKLREKISVDN